MACRKTDQSDERKMYLGKEKKKRHFIFNVILIIMMVKW